MTEAWRPIAGYEGYYEVSNFGTVQSRAFGYPRPLSPVLDGAGYPTVSGMTSRKPSLSIGET
jgi:hypothetical protein